MSSVSVDLSNFIAARVLHVKDLIGVDAASDDILSEMEGAIERTNLAIKEKRMTTTLLAALIASHNNVLAVSMEKAYFLGFKDALRILSLDV